MESDLKIATAPKVYFVGRTQLVNHGTDGIPCLEDYFIDHNIKWRPLGNHQGQDVIEVGGRLCYDSFDAQRPGGQQTYMNNILESAHGAVIEHASYNFIFAKISRSCSHEIVRHRAGFAYSQRSQRYVDESQATFIMPADIAAGSIEDQQRWVATVNTLRQEYKWNVDTTQQRLIDEKEDQTDIRDKRELRKRARQAARSIMPNCTETQIMVSANIRALRNFIELRGSRHADLEIQQVAFQVLNIMQFEAPFLFGDYKILDVDIQGRKEIKTDWMKV